jgi:hypothetical protein
VCVCARATRAPPEATNLEFPRKAVSIHLNPSPETKRPAQTKAARHSPPMWSNLISLTYSSWLFFCLVFA